MPQVTPASAQDADNSDAQSHSARQAEKRIERTRQVSTIHVMSPEEQTIVRKANRIAARKHRIRIAQKKEESAKRYEALGQNIDAMRVQISELEADKAQMIQYILSNRPQYPFLNPSVSPEENRDGLRVVYRPK